jgi:hypothetical protein
VALFLGELVMNLYIAIDDTDNLESIGTGRLARMLAENLSDRGLVTYTNVTRHQLLVHPDVPYTSHNSCACIEAATSNGDREKVAQAAKTFLLEHFNEGANPGLCVVQKEVVPRQLTPFGVRAQQEVIDLDEGLTLADSIDAFTWRAGETGQGCIGALAGIGLRSSGMDGRFLALEGIRDVGGVVTVGEILQRTKTSAVETIEGQTLPDRELVDTLDWVRPTLRNGRPVLVVKKNGTYWHPAERMKRKKKKKD